MEKVAKRTSGLSDGKQYPLLIDIGKVERFASALPSFKVGKRRGRLKKEGGPVILIYVGWELLRGSTTLKKVVT